VAYVTKRKSALPDAKRDPEMGQLNSPWPTYGGSANYTIGLSGTVWPLHMGAGLYALAIPANGYLLFAKFFFDHVTKPMVWGHSGGMGHTGTYFCFP